MRNIILALFILFKVSIANSSDYLREYQIMHLFDDIQKSLTAADLNIAQWEKKITCFNVGKLQVLAMIGTAATKSYLKNTPHNAKKSEKILKISDHLDNFCTNEIEKISFKGIALSVRIKKLKNTLDKVYNQLTTNFLEGANVKFGFDRSKQLFLNALENIPTSFESAVALSETEVEGHKYKPTACLAVGRLSAAFAIYKVEATRNHINLSQLIHAQDPINQLSDICYNKRGLSKYLRELEKLEEIIK